jgi:hypothetical protein
VPAEAVAPAMPAGERSGRQRDDQQSHEARHEFQDKHAIKNSARSAEGRVDPRDVDPRPFPIPRQNVRFTLYFNE